MLNEDNPDPDDREEDAHHSVGEHEVTNEESPPPAQSNLLDPYVYDLIHVHVKPPMSEQPLGMTLKKLGDGVFSVIDVIEPQLAYIHGVQIGWFLLSCNGKSPTSENGQELKPNEKGIRMTFAYRRETTWTPQNPQVFLDKYRKQRLTGCEYLIRRVKMTPHKLILLKLRDDSNEEKRVRVGPDADRQVLNEFEMRVGDAVLGVNEFTVRERRQCEFYMGLGYDLVDLVIERDPNSAPPDAAPTTTGDSDVQIVELSLSTPDDFPFYKSGHTGNSIQAYGWDDDSDDTPCKPPSSNPAAGVPSLVPPDVVQIVQPQQRDQVLANVTRSVRRGKRQKGPMNQTNERGTVSPPTANIPDAAPHARVVNVTSQSLKKPPTNEPDKN